MSTIDKRLDKLEEEINQGGDKKPYVVFYTDPDGAEDVYWRDSQRTGEPVTDAEYAELAATAKAVIVVRYEKGKLPG